MALPVTEVERPGPVIRPDPTPDKDPEVFDLATRPSAPVVQRYETLKYCFTNAER